MRRALTLIFPFLILLQPLFAFGENVLPMEVEQFLGTRRVIGSVSFAQGRTALSPEAKGVIDNLIPQLKKIDPARNLVRIEGFASPEGGKSLNVPISMARARAVIDYIQEKHPFAADFFLTGFGAEGIRSSADAQGCRAEIAIYDNIFESTGLEIEKVGYRKPE